MPKAYVIAFLKINNLEAMAADYLPHVEKTITDHGGRYLVRGGEVSYSEANPNPVSVVLEFPDREAALGWLNSDAYQAIKPGRTDNSEGPLVIVDGV